jgi:hypothetical protein
MTLICRNIQSDAPKTVPVIFPIPETSDTFSRTSLPFCKTLHPWYLGAHHETRNYNMLGVKGIESVRQDILQMQLAET